MAPIAALLIALMVYSLIQPVAFSLINTLTGKGVRREGKGQESAICLLLTLPLVMKSMSGRRYDKMDQMDKNLYSGTILQPTSILLSISIIV